MKLAKVFFAASFVWFVGGILLAVSESPLLDQFEYGTVLSTWILGFWGLFMIGSACWAEAKGYSGLLGLLLGLFVPWGLIVLWFLPKKTRLPGNQETPP